MAQTLQNNGTIDADAVSPIMVQATMASSGEQAENTLIDMMKNTSPPEEIPPLSVDELEAALGLDADGDANSPVGMSQATGLDLSVPVTAEPSKWQLNRVKKGMQSLRVLALREAVARAQMMGAPDAMALRLVAAINEVSFVVDFLMGDVLPFPRSGKFRELVNQWRRHVGAA